MSAIPNHIAVIMDGNGRWAKSQGLKRAAGHRAGVESVRTLCECCVKAGVKYLTLYSFSSENWGRDLSEVQALMGLFKEFLESERSTIMDNGIRLNAIGELKDLPLIVRTALKRTMDESKDNDTLVLTLAVNYGSRQEIVRATQKIAEKVSHGDIRPKNIDEKMIQKELWTHDLPDPDLLIRTSGEHRISNFLLWQIAYTEVLILDEFWPDFSPEIFDACISNFTSRERRFGCTSDQISTKVHNKIANKFGFSLGSN